MVCGKCGKQIQPNLKFCTGCGEKVAAPESPAAASPATGPARTARKPSSPPVQTDPKKKAAKPSGKTPGGAEEPLPSLIRKDAVQKKGGKVPPEINMPVPFTTREGAYVYCGRCNHKNSTDALRCRECGKALLPVPLRGERLIFLFLGSLGIGIFVFFWVNEVLVIAPAGILWTWFFLKLAFRQTKHYDKYVQRAERYEELCPRQVVNDCTRALACVDMKDSEEKAEILKMRADAYMKLERKDEAMQDYQESRNLFHEHGSLAE